MNNIAEKAAKRLLCNHEHLTIKTKYFRQDTYETILIWQCDNCGYCFEKNASELYIKVIDTFKILGVSAKDATRHLMIVSDVGA